MNTARIAISDDVSFHRPQLDRKPGLVSVSVFVLLLGTGATYAALSLGRDVTQSGAETTSYLSFLLLGVALLIALGFEFVNGFHDTANAVATVIYTHSLPPTFAVIWVLRWSSRS